MSLSSTWCYCSDNHWYEEPVWEGRDEDGNKIWFLCLDDDDPPEMVIKINERLPNRNQYCKLFPELDFIKYTTNLANTAGRFFGDSDDDWTSHLAASRWCEFTKIPPPPDRYDTKSDDGTMPSQVHCFFDFRLVR